MNKKNLNKFQKRRSVAAIAAILLVLLVVFAVKTILPVKKHERPGKTSLMFNNEVLDLKKEAFVEDGNYYISMEDIMDLFDSTLYYNEAEKQLITTFNTHIAVLNVNQDYMILNDSTIQLKGKLLEKEGIVYLPISDLDILYDVEIEYSEENNRVILSSINTEKKQAITLKKTYLYTKPSSISKKIEKVEASKYVIVIGEKGKYKRVRTENGNIGFIKSSKISNEEVIRHEYIEPKLEANIIKELSDNISLDTTKQNVIIPELFVVDNNQRVIDRVNISEDFKKYSNWAEQNDVKIWPTITISTNISQDFLTYNQRNVIINNIYQNLMKYRFSGINIDFEKIDDINSFNRFLIEIKPKLKESGIKLCITYNETMDKEKVQKIADIVLDK